MKRGRPPLNIPKEDRDKPILKYTQEFVDEDTGVKVVWHFDKTKYPNGPYKVEQFFPANFKDDVTLLEEKQKNMPLTKRKYYHPETGDLIGYTSYMSYVKAGKAPPPEKMYEHI